VGRGTAVSRQLPVSPGYDAVAHRHEKRTEGCLAPSLHVATRVDLLRRVPNLKPVEGSIQGAFRAGQPALDRFPYEIWARLIARRARRSLSAVAYYQPPAGHHPLREAIATQLGISRGVRCTPEQIILTTGAQGALDLVVRTLLNGGEAAWVEDPGYFGARGARWSLPERGWCQSRLIRRDSTWQAGNDGVRMPAWSSPHPHINFPPG